MAFFSINSFQKSPHFPQYTKYKGLKKPDLKIPQAQDFICSNCKDHFPYFILKLFSNYIYYDHIVIDLYLSFKMIDFKIHFSKFLHFFLRFHLLTFL